MERVQISRFKAECLAILERVRRTKKPIVVTRFGKPVAEIRPPSIEQARGDGFGCMPGIRITGDIVQPAADPEDWEVLRV